MNFNVVSLDTLLILMRQARLRLKKYEQMRIDGENTAADRLIPQMLVLRQELAAAYRGLAQTTDSDERPTLEVEEQVRFLLGALAPGRSRPSKEILEDASLVIRRHRRRTSSDSDSPRIPIAKPLRTFRPSNTETMKLDDEEGEVVVA